MDREVSKEQQTRHILDGTVMRSSIRAYSDASSLPSRWQFRQKPFEISLLQSITKIVEAVGIEHDPIFLSPAILRRCNRVSNPCADSTDSGVSCSRTLISALQETLLPCSGFLVVRRTRQVALMPKIDCLSRKTTVAALSKLRNYLLASWTLPQRVC